MQAGSKGHPGGKQESSVECHIMEQREALKLRNITIGEIKNVQGEPRTILRKLTCRRKHPGWENKINKILREEEEVERRLNKY